MAVLTYRTQKKPNKFDLSLNNLINLLFIVFNFINGIFLKVQRYICDFIHD